MRELEYPFDNEWILRKRKWIKKQLLTTSDELPFLELNIAVLGGSTTNDIIQILELFLLNHRIKARFYESEYGRYWETAMFDEMDKHLFKPDIIYIHTSTRNIQEFPSINDSLENVDRLLLDYYQKFTQMWDKLYKNYHCSIIQNNFELPYYRVMGNRDASDIHGFENFITRLNDKFYEYSRNHEHFYINDICWLSANYGLQKWSDPYYWYMYKYVLAISAIPELSYNISNIIKSIYGKNKKAIVLDLDNTIWGGVVGEDGSDGIHIGPEDPIGLMYYEFQKYIKKQKELGIVLNINSKNEENNALQGLKRPECPLKPEDFLVIKANWNNKYDNLVEIAEELNIDKGSIVFIDDNPAEREIIRLNCDKIAVPDLNEAETFLSTIDRCGYFEITNLSQEDINKNEMYKANIQRKKQQISFKDFEDYLNSLNMEAEIKPFSSQVLPRIMQLINKTNQFNLTTVRYGINELKEFQNDKNMVTLYANLKDRFGDNGIVTVLICQNKAEEAHIIEWLMSCRVFKRNLELAMFDTLIGICMKQGIKKIKGYYKPTDKNIIVKDFYESIGFTKISENHKGETIYEFLIQPEYHLMNHVIKVII